MTIQLPTDLKDRLDELAQATRRDGAHLAAEALAAYVDRELAVIDGIRRGLADMEAGRVTPHEKVMAQAQRIIDEVRERKARHP